MFAQRAMPLLVFCCGGKSVEDQAKRPKQRNNPRVLRRSITITLSMTKAQIESTQTHQPVSECFLAGASAVTSFHRSRGFQAQRLAATMSTTTSGRFTRSTRIMDPAPPQLGDRPRPVTELRR